MKVTQLEKCMTMKHPFLASYGVTIQSIIQSFEKAHFIKMNELKLTQVELFQFVHFMCVTANASEFFCMVHLANIERFL